MKPEPLNLDIQLKVNLTYKWGNEYDFINFKKGYEKGFSEAQKVILKIVKQRIKSACEFYLRYKDNPKLLISEHKKYYDDVVGNFFRSFNSKTLEEYYDIDKYNEWLFKLAFKAMLEGENQ